MRRFSILGAGAALLLTTATVLATPGSGITPVDLARGTSAAAYTITAQANRDIATQTLTFAPGGSTSGWHTHPGPVAVIVKSGTMSIWFSSDCLLRTVTTGQAILVPGAGVFDLARNEDPTVPLVLVLTYYDVPVGAPLRSGNTAQCSSAVPAVPQDTAPANVTAVDHTRVRLGAALSITGAANTDLLIQQLTFAPGATTGWHSHPGPLTVAVEVGGLTFHHSDCTTTPYPAGTAFLDPGVVHQATSAGATTAFVTYTNLPVGGAARIDQPAPACAVPAPAATALPNTASEAVIGGDSGTGLIALTVLLAIGSGGLLVWRRRSS